MESSIDIFDGLKISVEIGTISLVFSLIFGTLFLIGLTSKYKPIRVVFNGIIEVVYGVPLIALIGVFYYGIPLFTPIVTSIIVLSIVGIMDIAFWGRSLMRERDLDTNITTFLKVISVIAIREWSRLINYSALLSIIGVAELLRIAKITMNSEGNVLIFVVAIMIYIVIHLISKIIEYILTRTLFSNGKQLKF